MGCIFTQFFLILWHLFNELGQVSEVGFTICSHSLCISKLFQLFGDLPIKVDLQGSVLQVSRGKRDNFP